MNARPSSIVLSLILAQILLFPFASSAQQIGDRNFIPLVENPVYSKGTGPVVLIDEAHHNFHTSTAGYYTFSELLRRDGYTVRANTLRFSRKGLRGADILVIANALNERNVEDWTLPTPSAFDDAEIDAVLAWVNDGGALYLIADHMPCPGAAEALAKRFGFLLCNGFALKPNGTGLIQFRLSDGTLHKHPIVTGRNPLETVGLVTSFTGQAFRIRPGSEIRPILTLPDDTILYLPVEAWQFTDKTPRISAAGMLQGGAVSYGKGRVAVFGEAAMFTAQTAGPSRRPMGMNHPDAPQNVQFILNIMHWLSGLLPDR